MQQLTEQHPAPSKPVYELVLKNDKIQQYNRISFFIQVINILFFVYISFSAAGRSQKAIAAAAVLVTFGILFLKFFHQAFQQNKFFFTIGFSTAAVFAVALGQYWAAALNLLFLLLERQSQKTIRVSVTNEKIIYPSLLNRTINWTELNNMVLKDGMLTIDFRNNKLLQAEVDLDTALPDEADFNRFCREKLHRAG